jgi:hypothetical protein
MRMAVISMALAAGVTLAACSSAKPLSQAAAPDHRYGPVASSDDQQRPPASTGHPHRDAARPSVFGVGIMRLVFVDSSRKTLDYAASPPALVSPHRTLVVELRYPVSPGVGGNGEIRSGPPALRFGPFPVVVFAHGYAVMPDTYRPMLDSWVRSGFVVASPVFPVTNYYEWRRLGGRTAPEEDVGNQPADLAFVIRKLLSLAKSGRFARLLDRRRVAFAGQSDGAATVAGLAFASYYRPVWNALPVRPRALIVLSGAEFDGAGAYRPPPQRTLALLEVQSDADHCDLPSNGSKLFAAVAGGLPEHFFLVLHGSDHIAPFVGVEPWSRVVERVTTYFLRLVLHLPTGVTHLGRSGLLAAGSVPGIARITTVDHVHVTLSPPASGCGTPEPYPTSDA